VLLQPFDIPTTRVDDFDCFRDFRRDARNGLQQLDTWHLGVRGHGDCAATVAAAMLDEADQQSHEPGSRHTAFELHFRT
jgi:hypothetical protein